ncbi:34725_t:CDS:2, partial [Racocetra persica]
MSSLHSKRIVFDRTFPDFKQDLERLFNFTGLDPVSGMNISLLVKRLVYDMCTSYPKPHTKKLFNSIAEFLTQYTTKIRMSILDHDDVVSAYVREWEHYRVASDASSKICEYLNRLIMKKDPKDRSGMDRNRLVEDGKYRRQTVHALAYLIWKERIIDDIRLKHSDRFMYQIFELIRRDRDGKDTVPNVVADAINSL